MPTDSTVPQSRVLVLCFDGTANQYDGTNTNVVKFYALLDKRCPLEQIVYYQPGVGTFFNPGVVSPLFTWLAKRADEAVAWYLSEHVTGGYKFLMQNYRAGDKICLFGFSRGAYTARALAGLLLKIGLLPRDNEQQVPFAYNLYKRTDKTGLDLAAGFKQDFCAPVEIDFVGVWDTVASVGTFYGPDLPFTTANSAVRIFRHALSLDEHRARFQPNLFQLKTPRDPKKSATPVNAATEPPNLASGGEAHPRPRPSSGLTGLSSQEPHQNRGVPSSPGALGPEKKPPSGTPSNVFGTSEPIPAVQEVWFAGCHSDVGGGSVKNTDSNSLANIPLWWMVKQVILSQCGIKFDPAALKRAEINVYVSTIAPAGPMRTAAEQILRSESEAGVSSPTSPISPGEDGSGEHMIRGGRGENVEMQDWPRQQDVRADIHDQLKSRPMWWLLELLPMKYSWQEYDGTAWRWRYKWGINFGRGRKIRTEQPYFHDTVRQRMAIGELNYKPRAKWIEDTERYVE